jgi:protein-tyrosine phosphatase
MTADFRSVRVLFCCMGNICRSPTAEGVLRHMAQAAGLQDRIRIDSAGTHDYHVGHPPDRRTQATAAMRGYDLSNQRARQVSSRDFLDYDYILAMDADNLAHLQAIAPSTQRDKARLFLDYSTAHKGKEVPDPYYGGDDGFTLVLDMVEDGAAGLLSDIKKKLGL